MVGKEDLEDYNSTRFSIQPAHSPQPTQTQSAMLNYQTSQMAQPDNQSNSSNKPETKWEKSQN